MSRSGRLDWTGVSVPRQPCWPRLFARLKLGPLSLHVERPRVARLLGEATPHMGRTGRASLEGRPVISPATENGTLVVRSRLQTAHDHGRFLEDPRECAYRTPAAPLGGTIPGSVATSVLSRLARPPDDPQQFATVERLTTCVANNLNSNEVLIQ